MALQDSLLPQKQLKLATVPVQDDVQNDSPQGDDNLWDLKKERKQGIDAKQLDAFLDDALRELGPEKAEDAK